MTGKFSDIFYQKLWRQKTVQQLMEESDFQHYQQKAE